jgi:hypothetical protein
MTEYFKQITVSYINVTLQMRAEILPKKASNARHTTSYLASQCK